MGHLIYMPDGIGQLDIKPVSEFQSEYIIRMDIC